MPDLKLNNQVYDYPSAGKEPSWGEGATDWAEAVTDTLNSLAGTGTILETQVTIDNNTTKPVTGLLFNEAFTEGIEVTYRISRKTDSVEYSEKGSLSIVYKPSSVEKWFMSRVIDSGDDSLVALDINSSGQVIYTSTPLAGANYTGVIVFKTKNILE